MLTSQGQQRWVLIRRVPGSRYSFTLNVDSLRGAMAELALFTRDPAAYVEQRQRARSKLHSLGEEAVTPSPGHLDAVAKHLESQERSAGHIKDVRRYLAVWLDELRRVDLRLVGRAPLVAILNRHAKPKQVSKRNKLVVALLDYCSYLEHQGLLDPAQSPARHLHIVTADPARLHRQRHHTADVLAKAYGRIGPIKRSKRGGPKPEDDQPQAVRDAFRLMVAYGIHQTEVMRLARAGEDTQVRAVAGCAPIAGCVGFFHAKKRAWHWVSVDRHALAAVHRLQARKHAPNASTMRNYLAAACKAAKVERVLPSKLRHSFVTLAKEGGKLVRPKDAGLDLVDVAAITGHKSTATTSAYYDGSTVKPMVVLDALRLVHPQDPPPPGLRVVGGG